MTEVARAVSSDKQDEESGAEYTPDQATFPASACYQTGCCFWS